MLVGPMVGVTTSQAPVPKIPPLTIVSLLLSIWRMKPKEGIVRGSMVNNLLPLTFLSATTRVERHRPHLLATVLVLDCG